MTTWVGTSGWQYRDWRGPFYPPKLPQRLWLEHYVQHFATVEVNNAFYRLPERSTFEAWRSRTPPGFVVTVKASRYLTHIKRLRESAEPVGRLMERATGLGDRIGPVLVQLPPTLQADPPLLAETLNHFPDGVRIAVEPRHPSWWSDATLAVLEKAGAALSWADRLGQPVTPLWRTADWGYLRLHEGTADPWPRYRPRELREWAQRVADTWDDTADVYVYFNNDPGCAAITDAYAFADATRALGRRVPQATETPRATEAAAP